MYPPLSMIMIENRGKGREEGGEREKERRKKGTAMIYDNIWIISFPVIESPMSCYVEPW